MTKNGDILEMTLRDSEYNPILKEKVNVNDRKKMAQLLEKLHDKGVYFPTKWFD